MELVKDPPRWCVADCSVPKFVVLAVGTDQLRSTGRIITFRRERTNRKRALLEVL
jgi:hypothetical protein